MDSLTKPRSSSIKKSNTDDASPIIKGKIAYLENQLTKLTLEYENKIYHLQKKIQQFEEDNPKKTRNSENGKESIQECRIASLELELNSAKSELKMLRKKCEKLEGLQKMGYQEHLTSINTETTNNSLDNPKNSDLSFNNQQKLKKISQLINQITETNGNSIAENEILIKFKQLYTQIEELRNENRIKDEDIDALVKKLKQLVNDKNQGKIGDPKTQVAMRQDLSENMKMNKEQNWLIEDLKKRNKTLENELNILKNQTASRSSKFERARTPTIIKGKETLDKNRQLYISKSPILNDQKTQMEKDLKESEHMIFILKKELELAEKQIKEYEKTIQLLSNTNSKSNSTNSINFQTRSMQNSILKNTMNGSMGNNHVNIIKKLEMEITTLRTNLKITENHKNQLIKELNLYKNELDKQEKFFKNELLDLQNKLESNNEDKIKLIMKKFSNLQEEFINQKLLARKEIDTKIAIAKEKVELLQNELKTEGHYMESKMQMLQKEIEEWKQENEYISNKLRGYEQIIQEYEAQLDKQKKEKDVLDIEISQYKLIIKQLEKQLADIFVIAKENEEKKPSLHVQIIKNIQEAKNSVNDSKTIITAADTIYTQDSRPSSIGTSIYKDKFTGNLLGHETLNTTANKKPESIGRFPTITKKSDVNDSTNNIPDMLPPTIIDSEKLGKLDTARPIKFIEVCRRWQDAKNGDNSLRKDILVMFNKYPIMKKEALESQNFLNFLIILKNSLSAISPSLYLEALKILADVIQCGQFNQLILKKIMTWQAISKGLAPKNTDINEDEENFFLRINSCYLILNYYADCKYEWTSEFSTLLMEKNGLKNILLSLKGTSEWAKSQACLIIYYIVSQNQLINEVIQLNGISILFPLVYNQNMSIKKYALRTLAILFNSENGRESFLKEKKKIDEIIAQLDREDNEEIIAAIIDNIMNLSENEIIKKKIIDDENVLNFLINFLMQNKPISCKIMIYRLFISISPNPQSKSIIYKNLGPKAIPQNLKHLENDFQKSVLEALLHFTKDNQKLELDSPMFGDLINILHHAQSDDILELALKISVIFTNKYCEVFITILDNMECISRLVKLYEINQNANILFNITNMLLIMANQLKLKYKIIERGGQTFVKMLVSRLSSQILEISSATEQLFLKLIEGEDHGLINKYISKFDIRNLIYLLKADQQNMNLILAALKILAQLSVTDEFIEAYYTENICRPIFKILYNHNNNEEATLYCLQILHDLLCSLYGIEIFEDIMKMNDINGLKTMIRLIYPPTQTSRKYAQSSICYWQFLEHESNNELVLNSIKSTSTTEPILENLMKLYFDENTLPEIKNLLYTILLNFRKDKILAIQLEEFKNIKK